MKECNGSLDSLKYRRRKQRKIAKEGLTIDAGLPKIVQAFGKGVATCFHKEREYFLIFRLKQSCGQFLERPNVHSVPTM